MSSVELWFDSDSEEEEECPRIVALQRRKIRDASNPLDLPRSMFTKYFRVSKDLFAYLMQIVEPHLGTVVGSASVLPIIKLAAALRFFAEGNYQKGVGNDLYVAMAQPTTSKALTAVIDVLEAEICRTEIKFPTEEEKTDIKLTFFEKTGFPGIIGCVDGTHVRIICPAKDQHLYYNRKGFHSLNVMLVCDHKLLVRYVDANHPGSCHDSFVWNGSSVNRLLATNHENGERNSWLLGDAGYPLKPYLITPFRSTRNANSTGQEEHFNEIHSKNRITVERTIGVLKNTFRCILGARLLHYKPEKASKIVNVCCALHNLRIKFNMDLEEMEYDQNEPDDLPPDEEIDMDANQIRNEIMNALGL